MLSQVESLLQAMTERHPGLAVVREDVHRAFAALRDTFRAGGKLLVCGNGGSAADADHIVGELMKGFMKRRPPSREQASALRRADPAQGEWMADRLQQALPAVALTGHGALATAFANDVAHELVFAQQVFGLGRPGDALLAISTSGNSRNVLYAATAARAGGLRVIGLTGEDGGKLAPMCDVAVRVPARSTPAVQEYHLPVYHAICMMLEEEFFAEDQIMRG